MGRVRGKGKKQTVIASHDDLGSGEEEKIPAFRRRGRPAKPQKDDIEEDTEKKEEDTGDQIDSAINKDVKNLMNTENGKKRKRPVNAKENEDSVKEENGIGNKLSSNDTIKNAGFRHNNSRRKNPPRRAAEVGVECN